MFGFKYFILFKIYRNRHTGRTFSHTHIQEAADVTLSTPEIHRKQQHLVSAKEYQFSGFIKHGIMIYHTNLLFGAT